MKMSIRKKIFLFILIATTVAVFFLIALQIHSASTNNIGTSKITHINMLTNWDAYSEKNIAMSNIIKNYANIEPDVIINNTSLRGEEFYAKLVADFSSDCAADIVVAPPSYDIKHLYEQGYIADLSSELDSDSNWNESFDREMLKFVQDKSGQIYGLPTDIQYIMLYCNKELFEKYNITIPQKYSDFKSVVSSFSAAGVTPIAFGANDSDIYLYQILVSMFDNVIETENDQDQLAAQYLKALTEMQTLYNKGAFPSEYQHMSSDDARKMFLDNKAAMIVETNEFINDIMHGGNTYSNYSQYEILAFPYENRSLSRIVFSTVAYNAGDYTIFINKKSYEENHNTIMEFVKYLTKTDTLRLYLAQTNDIMTVKNIENKEYKMPLITECKIAVSNATKFTEMPIDITYRYIWCNFLQKKLPDMLEGKISAAQMLEKFNEACAKLKVKR